MMCFPFMDPGDLDSLRLEEDDARRTTVSVRNPVVDQESELRSTLVPALLHLARENYNRQAESVNLFEVARVFRAGEGSELPEERLRACALLTRSGAASLWAHDDTPLFFVAKGLAERLATASPRRLHRRCAALVRQPAARGPRA